jgi:L-alanine-DL-glutamate epimerase-like enolase superfamily enzyme
MKKSAVASDRVTNDSQFLGRKLSARIGAVTIPIKRFRLRNGLEMDRIYGAWVLLQEDDGRRGFGYTMHVDQPGAMAACEAIGNLLEALPLTPAHLLSIEEIAIDTRAVDRATRSASNALSLAAWDLAGHYFEQPCAQLWGASRKTLHCYDSNALAFAEDHELEGVAAACLRRGVRQAKMIVGQHSVEEDLERVEGVLRVLGPGNLAVDALCAWDPAQAGAFMEQVSELLLWVEDPVPYQQLGELTALHPIAAGERSTGLAELLSLAGQGVTGMLVDPGLLGGPLRQLEVSRALAAVQLDVGFHAYPYYLAHIAACLDHHLPVEIQNWGDPLFARRPQLNAAGELVIEGPGFGLEPDMMMVEGNSCMMRHIKS